MLFLFHSQCHRQCLSKSQDNKRRRKEWGDRKSVEMLQIWIRYMQIEISINAQPTTNKMRCVSPDMTSWKKSLIPNPCPRTVMPLERHAIAHSPMPLFCFVPVRTPTAVMPQNWRKKGKKNRTLWKSGCSRLLLLKIRLFAPPKSQT